MIGRDIGPLSPTPFVDDDKVDFESLDQLTSWYIEEGLHGLFVNGTTGEWFFANVF